MRKAKKILIIIGAIMIVLFTGISIFIGTQVFIGSTQLVTNGETKGVTEVFGEKYDLDYERFCTEYKIEELEITSSFDQHTIPGDYIYSIESRDSKNHQTIILVHGLGNNRYYNYPLAEYFLEMGYNVITFDQRSTNENTAKYTTFGYYEKYDVIDLVDYVEEYAQERKIGIWGASYGGATAGLALGYENMDERIDFMILDCPVSSMKWMVEQEMKNMDIGIPVGYMTWCGNMINNFKLGFTYQKANVASALKDMKTPVFIINSKVDSVTPYFMGKDIYDAIPENNREIWTVEDSAHCEIWLDYNQEYRDKIDDFLKKYK
jgi:fermentation-respiration switch protein FrsA (DUF1100 family)